jgi:heat-inducible transcriptional repressor
MKDGRELGRRQCEVLATLVRQYISTGLPVGSKAVADRLSEHLSSATIRNLMVELEAGGLLHQPHVSAGRVPTDKAYRFYVDHVAEVKSLGAATEKYIDESLSSQATSPEALPAKISHILSEVSHNVGLVLGLPLEEKLLEHIKFVRLPERRVLAVIVSKPDLVENKVIRLDEEFSQEELDRTADYLNAEFRGWSLRTIRVEIFKRIEDMKVAFARLLANVATLFMWGALAAEDPGPLFVDGTVKMLDQPEFMDGNRLRDLLAAFEEKAKLARVLSACLESSTTGVRVFIGGENVDAEMRHCTIIAAPYRYRDRAVGALGVVGPTRMEYDRAMTTVEYVAHLTSRLLSAN